MSYYPQQPQAPYPVQQPPYQPQPQYPVQQPPYPPQYPVQNYPAPQYAPQLTPEQQQERSYRRLLRRNANSIGTLLLIFFGLELILAIGISIVLMALNMTDEGSTGELFLLENGAISAIIFFFAGLIYCLIRRLRFSAIFPFDKIRGGLLVQLCVIGLTFSLMSNYVVDMINTTFGLFGIENTGGAIEVGENPNVLIYILTVAILPAFAEEFAFRGIVMGVLRPFSEGLAIFVSSAAFALMHGNFVQLPFTFCCGVVFAFIDIKTNSLLPSIIVHFLNNFLSVLSDVLISYKILDESTANLCYGIIFVITGILSFIFIKHIVNQDDGGFFRLRDGNAILPYKIKVKTTLTSPTIIVYTVIMLLYCVIGLFTA